jgi:Ca2+-binding EF-hand superfamily protein
MIKILTLLATLSPAAFAGDPRELPRDPTSVFKRLDHNGDGKITKDEFAKLRENLSEKTKTTTRDGVPLTDRIFDLMDENKDAVITLDEFKKFRERAAAKLKKRKPGESS